MLIREHIFENQDVVLDFHEYDHCEFKNCRMIVYGFGRFQLTNNRITDCQWVLAGPAQTTIQLMGTLYHGGGKELVESWFSEIKSAPPPSGR